MLRPAGTACPPANISSWAESLLRAKLAWKTALLARDGRRQPAELRGGHLVAARRLRRCVCHHYRQPAADIAMADSAPNPRTGAMLLPAGLSAPSWLPQAVNGTGTRSGPKAIYACVEWLVRPGPLQSSNGRNPL